MQQVLGFDTAGSGAGAGATGLGREEMLELCGRVLIICTVEDR
jgi:hypothetical protein